MYYDDKINFVLNQWLNEHAAHPYATAEQKQELASQITLTEHSVSRWLINARQKKKSMN